MDQETIYPGVAFPVVPNLIFHGQFSHHCVEVVHTKAVQGSTQLNSLCCKEECVQSSFIESHASTPARLCRYTSQPRTLNRGRGAHFAPWCPPSNPRVDIKDSHFAPLLSRPFSPADNHQPQTFHSSSPHSSTHRHLSSTLLTPPSLFHNDLHRRLLIQHFLSNRSCPVQGRQPHYRRRRPL